MEESKLMSKCGKAFQTEEQLNRHKAHNNRETRTKILSETLNKFNKVIVRKSKKKHICKLCDNSFNHAGNLKTHIYVVHEGHKDHKCEFCGKSFSQAGVMKTHIHSVHGYKDYKCESCGKSFSRIDTLKRHIHTIHKVTKITIVNCV